MSVYRRGEIWWVKIYVNGQPIRESTGQASKKKAQEFERRARERIEKEAAAHKLGKTLDHSFGDALVEWIKSGAPESMRSHARCVSAHMENIHLTHSVQAANDMVQSMLADGLSKQTINRRLAVVRRVLNMAYRTWKWLDEPLGQQIELFNEKGYARHIYLLQEQVTALLKAMQVDEAKRFLLLASYTGMRKSEIRSLKPHSWRKPNIRLDAKTKGGRPRSIPLVDELHWIMDHLPFSISEWDLRQDFEQARAAINMPELRMHDLRHTFASWLCEQPDVPLTVIRDMLGHSSLVVTSRYAHLRTKALQDAVSLISRHKKGHNGKRKSISRNAVSD
jgi:site-specific recombinase XerD